MVHNYKSALLFAAITVGATFIGSSAEAQQLLNPASQQKFINPLPIPPVIDATGGGTYDIQITQFEQSLGLRDGSGNSMLTTVWGYGEVGATYGVNNATGTYPGPTFVAKKNVGINVYWYNNLVNNNGPLPHLLPVDSSLHLANTNNWEMINGQWQSTGGVPIVTHLHGGHTESASDGLPESWYTPGFLYRGATYEKGEPGKPYHYDNSQQAATIWYHDHALGITRLNVYAGLAGFYILTDDDVEKGLQDANKLPKGPYDIGLAIQDRMFTSDGQLHYPAMPEIPGSPNPSVLPEFFGDFILVNGAAWPVLDVEPRQYRFRMLNGSDSRFYNLFFSEPLKFWQVASDLGLLPQPVAHDQMLISPGERKDVVVDFSNPALWGKTIIMRNNAKSPYPKGATPNPKHEGQIMAFRVSVPLDQQYSLNDYPLTPVPATLLAGGLPAPEPATKTRKLILFEGTDEYGRLQAMLGTFDGAKHYMDPTTEKPKLDSTEIWEIYNFTPDAHPIHLHLVSFRVLSIQKFKADINSETGEVVASSVKLLGQPKAPEAGQQGYKDTYPINPGEVVRFTAKFDKEGLYVWHCHILSHEDHEMMRPYEVIPHAAPRMEAVQVAAIKSNGIFSLYPNPLTSSTTLQYMAEAAGAVTVRIYDMQGRLVKEVFNSQVAKGEHQLEIDGSIFSSGVYICELNINNQQFRDRIVINK